MEFRTLLTGVIVFGLASGWLAQWVAPIVFTLAPDKEVMSSKGRTKCRNVRTVFDTQKSPPSCFGVVADDLANGTFQDRDREEHEQDRLDPEVQERMIEGMRDRIRASDEGE